MQSTTRHEDNTTSHKSQDLPDCTVDAKPQVPKHGTTYPNTGNCSALFLLVTGFDGFEHLFDDLGVQCFSRMKRNDNTHVGVSVYFVTAFGTNQLESSFQ